MAQLSEQVGRGFQLSEGNKLVEQNKCLWYVHNWPFLWDRTESPFKPKNWWNSFKLPPPPFHKEFMVTLVEESCAICHMLYAKDTWLENSCKTFKKNSFWKEVLSFLVEYIEGMFQSKLAHTTNNGTAQAVPTLCFEKQYNCYRLGKYFQTWILWSSFGFLSASCSEAHASWDHILFLSLDVHELWRSVRSVSSLRQQWATLLLGWGTTSGALLISLMALWLALVDRNPMQCCYCFFYIRGRVSRPFRGYYSH